MVLKVKIIRPFSVSPTSQILVPRCDKTFTFLKSIRLYISTDGTDEIELAYSDDINATSNSIELACTSQKLDKYIKAPSYKIRTKAVIKETITKDVTVKCDMKYKVTADPF